MQTQEPITEAIIIHPYLYQKFIKQDKNFHNLIALYLFYLHNAQLQKTNQILATDGFVHNGLGWGLEKIKKIKAILKKLGVIEMVRNGYYSYIKLIYIYSKKKIAEVLEQKEESKPKEKSLFQIDLEKNGIEPKKAEEIRTKIAKVTEKKDIKNIQISALSKWVVYCENSHITYNEKNISKWINTLNSSVTVEQFLLVNRAINKGWKSIYPISLKESKYQKFLGRSIKYRDKLYEKLKNVLIQNKKIFYIFKDNRQLSTPLSSISIDEMFERYEFVGDNK